MNTAFSWYPNEQCCLQAKPKFPLFCSETITIHKPDLIYIVCCKCSKTLKHLQLSLDISAHEEFIITLFSGKPHAVQYLKIQTFSQASTLLINCILIKYSFYRSCETVNKQTFGCTKFKFNIKGVLQVQNNSAVSTISVV